MKSLIDDDFSIGKLDGLTWDEIAGHSAEVGLEDGEVLYRGQFLCFAFNDADGGSTLDGRHEPMTDLAVQLRIDEIDRDSPRTADDREAACS